MEAPETQFARAPDGSRVAYQVIGDGPVDVIVSGPPFISVELMWEEPRMLRFLVGLSSFCRHIWFDQRGTGVSDRIAHEDGRLVECVVDDMVAVLDEVGCRNAAVLGSVVPAPILLAATHPQRVGALVLLNTSACLRGGDGVASIGDEIIEQSLERANQGLGLSLDRYAPSLAEDAAFDRWIHRSERLSVSPAERAWRARASFETDLRPVLGSVNVPTLVVYRRDTALAEHSRYLADQIPNATSAELPGEDLLPFVGDIDPILDAIAAFLTTDVPTRTIDRELATVLFTDIVASTEQSMSMGDRRWRNVLDSHDAITRTIIDRHRGRLVKLTGDGTLATFDGPGRAIRCAIALRDALGSLGIEIRAGLHTGEIELRGDDIGGIGVHVAARVCAQAGRREVFVSAALPLLVAGSGIDFNDRGEHALKGLPGTWQLLAVNA